MQYKYAVPGNEEPSFFWPSSIIVTDDYIYHMERKVSKKTPMLPAAYTTYTFLLCIAFSFFTSGV